MNIRDVPHKANHVLHLILIAFLLIFLRVWFLTTIKHDEYREKALKPQRRTVVESPSRGIICDRFNIPLAINKVEYNAAIYYNQIREIPLVTWIEEEGKKIKVHERRLYIEKLSQMLGKALDMDPVKIEDLIYSKASIFPNTPFILKKDISESLYYQLRFQEKTWAGLQMQRSNKRYYPQGKVGSDIIGYMGAINQRQYLEIAQEMGDLREFLETWEEGTPIPLPKGFLSIGEVKKRLLELKEKSYTIRAFVGKTGIERKFDETLRGSYGKRRIEIGARGRFIRNLPHFKKSVSGERISLTISSELQAYAEELLIQNEQDRDRHFALAGKKHATIFPPWIKGGAIIATIPSTGEVVALASYPRFDPNDFVKTGKDRREKMASIHKWIESPIYIGKLWDGLSPLEREHLDYTEKQIVTWDLYLDMILSLKGSVRKSLKRVESVKQGLELQYLFLALLKLSGTDSTATLMNVLYPETKGHTLSPYGREALQQIAKNLEGALSQKVRKTLDLSLSSIKHNDDKLLFLDLLRVSANGELFSPSTLKTTGEISLGTYRRLNQSFAVIQSEIKRQVEALYQEQIFPLWRQKHFKAYLKEKRKREKERKTYAHAYTDYLTRAKTKLFGEFWEEHKWTFFEAFIFGKIGAEVDLHPFLFHLVLKSNHLSKDLQKSLEMLKTQNLEMLTTFQCYSNLSSPLWGRYYGLRGQTLRDLAGAFYPKNGFGYGKSSAYTRATILGSLFKIVTGYEALKQTYLRHQDLNPLTIIDEIDTKTSTKKGIVLGRYLDGTPITRQYKGGRMPRSYAPLGKIDFQTAIERSSNIYFSLLAGEIIDHPEDLQKTAEDFGFGKKTGIDLCGEIGGYVPDDLRFNQTGLYAFAIGQHSLVATPLQAAMMMSAIGNGGNVLKPQIIKGHPTEINHTLYMPAPIRRELVEGMRRVVMGEKGPVQPHRIRSLYEHPKWIPEYKALQNQLIGKTSTAEFAYRPTLDREGGGLICKDIWFGTLSFKEGESYQFDMPDLCVIIYLKFGDYGKEAAPLAAQIIKRWREIEKRHKIKG